MKIIRFTWDWIAMNFKKSLLSILIMVVAFFLGMLSVMSFMEEKLAYVSIEECLNYSTEKTLIIGVDILNSYDTNGFINKAYESPEIAAIGAVEVRSMVNSELFEVQKGHSWNPAYSLDNEVEVAIINIEGLDVCPLKLQNGAYPSELDFTDNKISYLYLGSAYKDIPVGTVYEGNNGYKKIVAGIMEDGQRWVNSDLLWGYSPSRLNYSWDCTYAVFCVENSMLAVNCFAAVADGYTVDEAIKALNEVAEETGCVITYSAVENICEEGAKESKALTSYIVRLLVIIMVASSIMLISVQVVIILKNTKNYGVMYAVGFNKTEILKAQFLKQIILSLCALVIAGVAIYYFAYQSYFLNADIEYIMKTILARYVFPAGVLQAGLVVVMIQIITAFMFKRMTPDKLIRSTF